MLFNFWLLPILLMTTLWQAIACYKENQQKPPGKLINIGNRQLHLLHLPAKDAAVAKRPTVVIDHSLGGVEGYLLIEEINRLAEVCMCDRAGYGWSDISRDMPTSEQSISDLNKALAKAEIEPPYILVGDSLGSYNVRLYASRFPEQVVGMVLTDGLHERAMLKMGWGLRSLQALFLSGFVMSILGSALGIIRVCDRCGLFPIVKPQLKKFPPSALRPVLRSFCRPKHWLTMAREIACLDRSGQQLLSANKFGDLPIINIKARCFLDLPVLSKWPPLKSADRLRDDMHKQLMRLSTQCQQLQADKSGHFVWVDQPELIVQAVQNLLNKKG